MDDDKKVKRSIYFNESTWSAMSDYISLNYSSSYGAVSQTVDEAVSFYIQQPESIKHNDETTAFRNKRWAYYQTMLKEEVNQEECATE